MHLPATNSIPDTVTDDTKTGGGQKTGPGHYNTTVHNGVITGKLCLNNTQMFTNGTITMNEEGF